MIAALGMEEVRSQLSTSAKQRCDHVGFWQMDGWADVWVAFDCLSNRADLLVPPASIKSNVMSACIICFGDV